MKKLFIFLILLNICFFSLAFAVNLHFPFDEWRKGPPVHNISVYSSGNASKVFWVSTAGLLDLYIFLISLFNRIIKSKKRIFPSRGFCLIAVGAAIFAGSLFTIEYAVRLYIKNSPGYSQFRPHPLLFWYNRPNFKKAFISINSSGFRYKEEIPVNKPPGEYRVFVLGDSSAFGDGVSDEETFSVQLEKKLNNKYRGCKFRVINAACPGHTTYQGLILLKQELLKFDPNILIVAYNNDPGLEYSEEKKRSVDNPFMRGLNVILYHSDYYLLFQRVVTDFKLSLLAKFKVKNTPFLVRRVSLEDYKNNLQEFMRISKGSNIRVLFVKMPVNLQAFRDFPFLKELFYDEKYRDTLVDICRNKGYALVDVDSNWPVKNGQGLFEMVEHDGKIGEAHFHPSPKGHLKIAEQLYGWIIQQSSFEPSYNKGSWCRPGSEKIYKIRIGCSSLTPVHCMLGEIFKHTDILSKHNLEGEVVFFQHGVDQEDASRSGKIDVTFSCEVPVVFHLANTSSLRIVGTPGSLGRIALIVPADSGIFSLQDLKRKVILIHKGSSAVMTVRKWLQDAELNPDQDVKLAYSDKEGVLDRLSRKEADAVVSWDPWLEEFLQKQNLRVVKERLFRSVVVVSEDYILKSPEAVVRYEAALKDAFLWALDNKKTVADWVSQRSGIKQSVVEKVLSLNENWSLPSDSKEKIFLNLKQEDLDILQECNNYVVKTGQIPADFDIKKKINTVIFDK
jgi:ABC-type nitrate/sulfonate/bicarbonate transport system substrate-binding protein